MKTGDRSQIPIARTGVRTNEPCTSCIIKFERKGSEKAEEVGGTVKVERALGPDKKWVVSHSQVRNS